MNKLHGSREEFRFHKMWSEAFKRAEKESLFGIGFNPYLVEKYTTENIIDYLEIYKSKRRYQPTKSFRVAIKWLVVCIMILIFGLRGIDSYFLYVVEKIEIYEKSYYNISCVFDFCCKLLARHNIKYFTLKSLQTSKRRYRFHVCNSGKYHQLPIG